jgi:hypothetical protein
VGEDRREEEMTSPGLVALMSNLVDYAGLFPPAKLDMAATVATYADALAGDDAWMLERLIVPAARLDELEAHAAGRLPTDETEEPWPISVLTAPAGDERLDDDLARIAAFNAAHATPENGLAIVDAIELKASASADADRALDRIPDEIFPFFELPVTEDLRGILATLVGGEAGAKVRTGGVTADLYPAPADVARFIAGCAASGVPFKATAGLHHPLRHFSEAVQTDEFGFLNVFVAGVLALVHDLDVETIAAVLETRTLDDLVFDEEGLAWRDHRVDAETVEDARLSFAVSYGCCSFDDPRAGLRQLQLLP